MLQHDRTPAEGGRKVLVVEDDDPLRAVICSALTDSGFRVSSAGNGAQALAMLLSESFDAMVLDVILPGMSGLAVLEELRRCGRSLPVVLVSGYLRMLDAVHSRNLGIRTLLSKPFKMEQLIVSVETLLGDSSTSPGTRDQPSDDEQKDAHSSQHRRPHGERRRVNLGG